MSAWIPTQGDAVEIRYSEGGEAMAEDEWAEGMRKLLEGLEAGQGEHSNGDNAGQTMENKVEELGEMGFEWALNDTGVEMAV